MKHGELLVISGTAHPALAKDIVEHLGVDLVDVDLTPFPDGETGVTIKDNVREQDVFIIQPTGPPANHNYMETFILIDALKRASADRITVVSPYWGYGRQDRKDRSRVPITAALVTNLYKTAGADRLLTVNLHSAQTQGFTDLPFDHLYAVRPITDRLRLELDHPVVAAPDIGAVKMAEGFAGRLGTPDEWAIVTKKRIDGRTTKAGIVINQSVDGRNVLVVDDMISTASTLLGAAAILKGHGATSVSVAATHGVFCENAIGRIEASPHLDRVYVTDSLPEREPSKKIRRITIAPLLAQAIFRIHNGESVSDLF